VPPIRDPDLAALVASWSELPDHVRLTIRTLLDAAGVGRGFPSSKQDFEP
jgi:hypothetical protein